MLTVDIMNQIDQDELFLLDDGFIDEEDILEYNERIKKDTPEMRQYRMQSKIETKELLEKGYTPEPIKD